MRRSKKVVLMMSSLVFFCAVMTVYGEDKRETSTDDGIIWGKVVDGLQYGILPEVGPDGRPVSLFDGQTLQLKVQVRNAGKTPVHLLPSTFGCAALGAHGCIPVTKLILTPIKGGEPLSITYQGHNHVSDKQQLDADDVKYFTTKLAPGQSLEYPYSLRFIPGEDRSTSWQRSGESNIVPAGKYQVKAVLVVDRKSSQWQGELTSGSMEVEFFQKDKNSK